MALKSVVLSRKMVVGDEGKDGGRIGLAVRERDEEDVILDLDFEDTLPPGEVDPITPSCHLPHPSDLFGPIGQSVTASQALPSDYDLEFDGVENQVDTGGVALDHAISETRSDCDDELPWESKPEIENSPPPSPPKTKMEDSIASIMVLLYLEYSQSIPKITSVTPKSLPSLMPAAQDPGASDDQGQNSNADQTEYAMSRHQLQLIIDEGKFWDEFISDKSKYEPPEAETEAELPIPEDADTTQAILKAETEAELPIPEDTDTPQAIIKSLAEKSSLISESYQRRNDVPTAQTFEESKEIIRAMGVPCLDSAGAYEAEALAASLVINGHADYVASEDTVC
jgi:hypothetical protein